MIYLPPPQPVLNKDIRISGDVEIHPTASLAPGVILQAAPNCRIIIGADVCIGMGVIVNASQGSVEIESGAILGSGVLIIGTCKVGNNACIGTAVTIFQVNIEPMTVIDPGSVLGDNSRKLKIEPQPQADRQNTQEEVVESQTNFGSKNGKFDSSSFQNNVQNTGFQATPSKVETSNLESNPTQASVEENTIETENKKPKDPVVGQVYINQLLVTLFPNNKDLNPDAKKLE